MDWLMEENSISENGEGEKISYEDMIDEFITFYGAGMDTTGHLAGMMVYYLVKYEHILVTILTILISHFQKKVVDEVDSVIKSDKDFTIENLNKLEYLDMVRKETARYYGPALSLFMRRCLKDNVLGK